MDVFLLLYLCRLPYVKNRHVFGLDLVLLAAKCATAAGDIHVAYLGKAAYL